MRILKATYGAGDNVIDVTERLQRLVKNGQLFLTVSNGLFTDPCPNRVKTLRFMYALPGSNQFYFHEVAEHRIVLAPTAGRNVGIFYTDNSVPAKYLDRVLGQLKKAANNVDILTCPWRPIEGNPFPEIPWSLYHARGFLTITLQILKLLHTAQELGTYDYVFFLEHDVLYPEGYFDIEPFSEDVLYNDNYIGLSQDGFQSGPPNLISLHLLVMRLPAAIEHFTSSIRGLLTLADPGFMLESHGRSMATRRNSEPVVHINHGTHVTPYFTVFSKDKVEESHPYWGSAASWWD